LLIKISFLWVPTEVCISHLMEELTGLNRQISPKFQSGTWSIQPDESDLILATHGRGVVIIDDISTLRSLTPEVLQNEVTFLPAKPAFIKASGYRVKETGDQAFYAPNESESAVIAYYLKSKHIFW
jgi:hypothetical protein